MYMHKLEKHFFFKALAVCSAFHSAALLIESPHCLVIYSDNTNTINIFNTLCASALYNQLLISAMNVVLDHNIYFWVLHVCGIDNPIANTILHFKNDLAVSLCSGLVIQSFEPPHDALGVILQTATPTCLDS
jgi:hypothetical protein